jgi:alkylhydroperoxidase family enzyme
MRTRPLPKRTKRCWRSSAISTAADWSAEQRLYLLDAWRESPFYSPRERAALAWTEAVTRVAETHVPDEVYEEARQHYSEKELVDLNWVVVAINAWNRLAIPFRFPPGT